MGEQPPGEFIGMSDLARLISAKSADRLNIICANGLRDHISPLQLVVCGDQSAGKSSVLEGITGIPFPCHEGFCTKFATEIVFRHKPDTSRITATLIPHAAANELDKERLRAYRRELSDFTELPTVISEAAFFMRIRGQYDATNGPLFSADVLRIEVVGKTGLHLTIVDLPGLISVPDNEHSEDDAKLVDNLVNSYLESPQTIILAVIQASNNIANQDIIQRTRKVDPEGRRTIGIITKPDLITGGLARLELDYFLIKNRDSLHRATGISLEIHENEERQFFASSIWKAQQLDMARVGIDALRVFLQELLDQHIENELPKVRVQVQMLLTHIQDELDDLGAERPTVRHLRMFLTQLSMNFHGLVQAALDGNYLESQSSFFNNSNEPGSSKRLRAEVQRLNSSFAEKMHTKGQKRRLCWRSPTPFKSTLETDSDTGSIIDPESENGQLLVNKAEYDAWVKTIYLQTKGQELPGNYNHVLLSELFYEQSSRWESIATQHVTEIFEMIVLFIQMALKQIITERGVREEIEELIKAKLDAIISKAMSELQNIVEDEKRPPITYNHYYTDNIQHARQQNTRKGFHNADWRGLANGNNTPFDSETSRTATQKQVIGDMDDHACSEASEGMYAYYKVALKTFVDNVCRQVIERHLLSNLADIFSPTTVTSFSEGELVRIASEPQQKKMRRAALQNMAQGLKMSLIVCKSNN